MNLLPLTVHRCALGDCTNGGVSSKMATIYVRHPEGFVPEGRTPKPLIFEAEDRSAGSLTYWALKPVHPQGGANSRLIGPMDGGNLAHTSDSRGGGLIYHIHDRFETPEENADLSR